MRKDEVFKKLAIVRKNMQGINGVELLPSVYNYLIDHLQIDVPKLEYVIGVDEREYVCEKDVENKLIKPLLARVGYTQEDYKQQLYMEVGNHNTALIPDFVLMPEKYKRHVTGFAVIEAKRSITTEKMLEEVLVQARSYARMLNATYCVVASQEKLWVSQKKDDYMNIVFETSWEALKDNDQLYKFEKMIGKKR